MSAVHVLSISLAYVKEIRSLCCLDMCLISSNERTTCFNNRMIRLSRHANERKIKYSVVLDAAAAEPGDSFRPT